MALPITTVSPPSRMLRASNYTVTDANSNTTTGTINVSIIDDVPMARCGHRQRDRRCGHERQRADRCWHDQRCGRCRHGGCGRLPVLPQVVGVAAGNNTSSPVSGGVGTVSGIAGSYGTFVPECRWHLHLRCQPECGHSNQTDTFIYTVQDGDGDLSTTTLTINVNNVSVTASDTEALVNEAGLPSGSDSGASSEAFNGAIACRRHGSLTPTR